VGWFAVGQTYSNWYVNGQHRAPVQDKRCGFLKAPIIQKIVNTMWFANKNDEGIKYQTWFKPFPVPALALILMVVSVMFHGRRWMGHHWQLALDWMLHRWVDNWHVDRHCLYSSWLPRDICFTSQVPTRFRWGDEGVWCIERYLCKDLQGQTVSMQAVFMFGYWCSSVSIPERLPSPRSHKMWCLRKSSRPQSKNIRRVQPQRMNRSDIK